MTAGDAFEGGFQIRERIDAVDLGRFDRGCDAAPGLSTFIMTRKKRVFSIEGDGADQIFDRVAVDLETAIGQECLQTRPVVGDVSELLAEAGFSGETCTLCGQPIAEGCDQGNVSVARTANRLPGHMLFVSASMA